MPLSLLAEQIPESTQSSQSLVSLVGFWPDYETQFLQNLQITGREIALINPLDRFTTSNSHKCLPRPIRNALYASVLKQQLRQHPEATFIFQDHRLILNALLKHGAPAHSGIILRNICDPNSKTGQALMALQDKGIKLFSFDRANCQQYGFTFYHQFIAAIPRQSTAKPSHDFCFIGKNKGRSQWLNQINDQAAACGYSMNINYIGDEPNDRFCKQIAYTQYLDRQLDCHCIVDINQQGQQGLTLRPLEAALYQKKLLSNNTSLREHALFHADNVLIMETEVTTQELTEFMEKPLQPISPDIMQRHQPRSVFQSIINSIDDIRN